MDESREIRIDSGQVIGLIMLLLAMLPRDVPSDLCEQVASYDDPGDVTLVSNFKCNVLWKSSELNS